MIVFLKTYEEAVCLMDSCNFQFIKTGLAALTSYSVDFDTELEDYVLTLVGTSFGGYEGDNTEVIIDGIHQRILSSNDTTVQALIVNVLDSSSKNIQFNLPVGVPDDTADLSANLGISMIPQFLSLSPNVGSPAGSLLTAHVPGVGINTSGITLQDSDGKNLCRSVKVSSYGIVECITLAAQVTQTSVQLSVNGNAFLC